MVRWNELGGRGSSEPPTTKGGPRFSELSVVALRRAIPAEQRIMPAGSKGTVVGVYQDGVGYEVEFNQPFHAVLTVEGTDLLAA